jgi:hypothetical protein
MEAVTGRESEDFDEGGCGPPGPAARGGGYAVHDDPETAENRDRHGERLAGVGRGVVAVVVVHGSLQWSSVRWR